MLLYFTRFSGSLKLWNCIAISRLRDTMGLLFNGLTYARICVLFILAKCPVSSLWKKALDLTDDSSSLFFFSSWNGSWPLATFLILLWRSLWNLWQSPYICVHVTITWAQPWMHTDQTQAYLTGERRGEVSCKISLNCPRTSLFLI